MLRRIFPISIVFLVLFSSCVPYKKMQMISSLDQVSSEDSALIYDLHPLYDYKFRQNDQLFIKVSAYEGDTKALFNDAGGAEGSGQTSQSLYFTNYNYLIDKDGYIELPLIGKEKVVGRTAAEIKNSLDKKLLDYLPNPSTIVRLSSFKITMLGEVETPGVHEIFSDRISILQAFGLSGGMTDYADLEHVKLVRETDDGRIGSVYLDLTKSDIHKSEFYFLRPGDVIYIEPLKAKAYATSTQSLSIVFQTLSFITVILNTTAVILNIRNNSN